MATIRSDGQMTRARVRAAGLQVVVNGGWEALTFKTVGLADVSWQTVKHHFRTLAGLREAVAAHMRDVLDSPEGRRNLGASVVRIVRLRLEQLEQVAAA